MMLSYMTLTLPYLAAIGRSVLVARSRTRRATR